MAQGQNRQQRMVGALALVGLLTASLAGCGTHGPAAPRDLHATTAPVTHPLPPRPAPGDAQAVLQAQHLLEGVKAQVAVTRNWTAKAHSEVVSPTGSRNYNTSQIVYKSPGTMAATVLSAKDGKSEGTKIIYRGGSDLDLKTYFFGFIAIKLTLKVDDDRLVDVYHRSLRDTQTQQLFDMLLNPAAQSVYLGEGQIQGEAVDFLDVRSPVSWKGIVHEVVGISRRLGLPISRACYTAQEKRIFHLELEGMRTNITPKANDFTLD